MHSPGILCVRSQNVCSPELLCIRSQNMRSTEILYVQSQNICILEIPCIRSKNVCLPLKYFAYVLAFTHKKYALPWNYFCLLAYYSWDILRNHFKNILSTPNICMACLCVHKVKILTTALWVSIKITIALVALSKDYKKNVFRHNYRGWVSIFISSKCSSDL